ncbi:recombination protein NinB [Burkholderia vietnamiensis]|uniref:recombination protein NinB n=1 Tax=Burkholderia vietnamiensis TaxID=60552 RepID=UPI0013F17D7B|nr:recombination protein NinB [Burkholderia vietnamiensis]
MTAALYREFTLRDGGIWTHVVAFIRANAQAFAERGEPLRIIVTAEEKQRNAAQNRKLHAMLSEIADNAWWNGQQYPMEFWKEYYRRRFLLKDEYTTPDGEIIQVYWSTAELSVGAFSELIQKIYVEAASDFGIEWQF